MWTSCLEEVHSRFIRGGGAAPLNGSSSGSHFLGHVAAHGHLADYLILVFILLLIGLFTSFYFMHTL
jgi:hypothetical protein